MTDISNYCPACECKDDTCRCTHTCGSSSRIDVLDHGYVELIDSMGDDLAIVNGARQSFDEASTEMTDRDKGLVNFLMREKHTSPFEQVQAKFAVQLPIFVAREWMRHRTQSFNEMSGRYTVLPELFYVPAREAIREQRGKPGAYYYEPMADGVAAERARTTIRRTSEAAFFEYQAMMSDGVAKEIARLVLPVNTYTKFVVSANLLNWMRFLSLRNHEHAQYEIRVYAEAIESMLIAVAPTAMEAFVEHGRLR